MASNTERTLKYLRGRGLKCGIVERFIHNIKPGFGRRSDLFKIFDIIAIHPEVGIIGVQSCGQAFKQHLIKMTVEEAESTQMWLASGGKVELIGWRKVKQKRGGKRLVWGPRIKVITLDDFRRKLS